MAMDPVLLDYLYKQKQLPLPGIGSLLVTYQRARVLQGEHKIAPPHQLIELSQDALSISDAVDYISRTKHIGEKAAESVLRQFAVSLKELPVGDKLTWRGAGTFFKQQDGEIGFTGEDIFSAFYKPVDAIRVIHPNETHTVLVGDTETTNAAMTEYFTDIPKRSVSRWYIAAICIFLLSLGVIIYYFTHPHPANAGNATPVQAGTEKPTYSSP
jgi:hypothetical protein